MSIDPTIDNMMKQKKQTPTPELPPEKEPASTVLLWVLGIIVLLIFGIFTIKYLYHPKEETITYNGFAFVHNKDGTWTTQYQINNYLLPLEMHYNPLETLNITPHTTTSWNSTLNVEQLTISFDPRPEDLSYVQVATTELAFKFKVLGINISVGYTVNGTETDLPKPVITCSTPNTTAIIVQETNTSAQIYLRDRCITITGNKEELIRASDRVIYTFFGIIPTLTQ